MFRAIPPRIVILVSTAAVVSFLVAGPVQATDRHVPSPYATIQAGISAAADGDEVIIAPGTYQGDGNRDIDFLGKAITVRSTDPDDPNLVAATVIDCQADESNHHRGFAFLGDEDANSVLAGLTIVNANVQGDPNVDDWLDYSGGGILIANYHSPVVRNCVIRDCVATYGGGIACLYDGGSPRIDGCTLIANSAEFGGGIASLSPDPIITNCTIIGNSAVGMSWPVPFGGGYDGFGGGGIVCGGEYSFAQITNCTIVGNACGTFGGGVSCFSGYSSVTVLTNCVLWGNTAGVGGPQLSLTGTFMMENGATANAAYSDLQGGQGDVSQGPTAVLNWGDGNMDADPLFVDPNGPDGDPNTWQDNDYHLSPNSPCINIGDPNGDYTGQTDIDGHPRVMDLRVDMGSDEYALCKLTLSIVNQPWGHVDVDPYAPGHIYEYETVVTLTGVANEGKVLKHWRIFDPNHPGDSNYAVNDSNNPLVLVMDRDHEVTTVFDCASGMGPFLPVIAAGLMGFVVRRRRWRR